MIGIYKITNKINNKSYIGQSVDIKRRFIEHKMLNREETLSLKRAFRKYGVENFTFEVLEECSIELLNEKEISYISLNKPEYNRTLGGTGAKGHKLSNELKETLREKGKQQWLNLSQEKKLERIKNNLKGPAKKHFVLQETKEKLRKCNLGKKQSKETIEKRKQTFKEKGYKQTNEGHKKKVLCVEMDIMFESVKEAGACFGIKPSCISGVLKGRYKTSKGYHFRYL
jgi:group I intron endonuclease